MPKTKKILMAVLAICLSACQNVPTIDVPQRVYDFNNQRCLERNYRFSAEYIGPRGATVEVDIEKCDLLIGYDPQTYVKVYDWIDERRRDFHDAKDSFQIGN